MRILVTGGAGFIGSVISASLLKEGHEVVVLDDLRYGQRNAVTQPALFELVDLTDAAGVMSVFKKYSFGAVVHVAAEASVKESTQDPGKFYSVNVQGGINILEGMRATGVERIIFSSTAAIFGEPEQIPITETSKKLPVNPYGESKLIFEKALAWYAKYFGFRHVSFRYFNACGATQDHGEDRKNEYHLIPVLLDFVQGKRTGLTLYGTDYPTPDGTCIRDYVHVADIAQAHVLGLNQIDDLTEVAFNLGSGSGNSNLQVIQTVREVTGDPLRYEVGDRRPGDPAVLVASADLAKSVLGWKPQFTELKDSVSSAWSWRCQNPHGYPK